MGKSDIHRKLDALKEELVAKATLGVLDGLPPLGALTATFAAIEEQVASIFRGIMLAEIMAPTDGRRLEEYHAVVEELVLTTRAHIIELHRLAKHGAEQGPIRKAKREIEQLESMFADPKRTQKPS